MLAQRAQGKTSLLRVAAGIERPDRGERRFEGEDIWEFSERRRSRLLGGQIGWVGPAVAGPRPADARQRRAAAVRDHGKSEAYARATGALSGWARRSAREQFWGEPGRLGARARRGRAGDRPRAEAAARRRPDAVARARRRSMQITRLLDTLAVEQGFAVLMSVSDAGATGWSRRVATLAGGELLETCDATRARATSSTSRAPRGAGMSTGAGSPRWLRPAGQRPRPPRRSVSARAARADKALSRRRRGAGPRRRRRLA